MTEKPVTDLPPKGVFEALAREYPVLYLNPDRDDREAFRSVVLRGADPPGKSLSHYRGSSFDAVETVETPVGPVRVATLGDRHDFELVMRGLMAAKDGPRAPIPPSQGAAMLTVFNWPRIRAHLAAFPPEEQGAAFNRFTAKKENYTDSLIVLSRGPYSGVPAAALSLTEKEWLRDSDTIRRFHEITHVICHRQYPDRIDPVRDELIADAVGLYAAYGAFDPEKERLFLGLRDGRYTGGRLENYTDRPEALAEKVDAAIRRIAEIIAGFGGQEQVSCLPFDLIPPLMETDF